MSGALRSLARTVLAATKTGTPIRHTRGTVVSSNIGQSTVTIDGGSTQIKAFNYGHAQSLPASTVVDVLLVGRKAYVIGAYQTAPPTDGAWTAATLAGAWVNAGGTSVFNAAYRMNAGRVYLRGNVKAGTGTIFTLPGAYRPQGYVDFAVMANGVFGWVQVQPGGAVVLGGGNASAGLDLSPVSFDLLS